jgi:hypothetical protein
VLISTLTRRRPAAVDLLLACLVSASSYSAVFREVVADQTRFVDHSLLVAPDYPVTWPAAPETPFSNHSSADHWTGQCVQR